LQHNDPFGSPVETSSTTDSFISGCWATWSTGLATSPGSSGFSW